MSFPLNETFVNDPFCVSLTSGRVSILPAAYAKEPSLEIMPSGDTQTRPIGSSIILTCKPKVDDTKLIKDMQWIDPQDHVIESLKYVQ